ncbi:MAG: putative porin [Calditrichaeota bacterium]|nr:putative porin [Calditrichota bacterium]
MTARRIAVCLVVFCLTTVPVRAQDSDSLHAAAVPSDSLQAPYWTVTDSTLLFSPHGNTAEILKEAPGVIYLSPGGYGQPGVLLSGAGDLQGMPVCWNNFSTRSYLIPFFDAQRLPWPKIQTLSLTTASIAGLGSNFALNLHPIFARHDRPFSRVSYSTKDFGRDEVFALFTKQVRPGLWLQGIGGLGTYGGYTPNSPYHFQTETGEVEKFFSSGKNLFLSYGAYTGEAGFPGPQGVFGSPSYPGLKRKVGETRLQGKLFSPITYHFSQALLWQVRYLREEWTNRSPFSHRRDDEWTGQFQWQGALRWKRHRILLIPGFHLTRLAYKNSVQHVIRMSGFISDRFPLFKDWQGAVALNLSGGNSRFSAQQIGFHIRKDGRPSPDFFARFTHQTGGFLAPVFRDSSSYHRAWLNFLPLLGQFPKQEIERPRTNFQEGMVLPLVARKSAAVSVLLSGVQWLEVPVVVESAGKIVAGNASLWGHAAFLNYWTLAGGANVHLTNGRQAEMLSAVPPVDSWGSLSFHHLFFQNDLDATVKLFFRFLGRTEFNVAGTSPWSAFRVRQPVFLLHLYGYFNVADVRFFVSFENILDNTYFLLPGYPAPGRTFRYGLVWDFWN